MDIHSCKYQSGQARISAIVAAVVVLILAIVGLSFVYETADTPSAQQADDARTAALASVDSPTIGDLNAPVHIVEFLDPACETCALFYPMVKQWLNEVPGKLRLSVRHVPFHEGSDQAVRILEASRAQGKYWETLEALLSSQAQWTQHHKVIPERIAPAVAGVGLDMVQLMADMESDIVRQRMEKDHADAVLLKVSATPEYFVNGRPLPSFGRQQLMNLVREELEKAAQDQ
jgi:protein-disulfide isomerase